MKPIILLGCASAILCSSGCTSHLVFMEESHTGLKIRVGASTPSPYEVSLGYRRGMVAAVPKQTPSRQGEAEESQPSTDTTHTPPNDKDKVILAEDSRELMSMYSEFCANVGFDSPIAFHNLLVTGDAAIWLLSGENNELRNALGRIKICDAVADSGS